MDFDTITIIKNSTMTQNTRDDSLDIIKGLACLIMVVAHQPVYKYEHSVALAVIAHISALIPPLMFFAISGITSSFQAGRYTLSSLSGYFGALFVLGFSWNIGMHGDITSYYWVEIFQLIALGSLGVCIVERNGPAPQWKLLTIGLTIIATKVVVEKYWPDLDGWNYLFCDTSYIPETEFPEASAMVAPGFPLIPWVAYFFLGVFCYRASKRLKLIMALGSLAMVFLSVSMGSSAIEKWDTSIAYIFANCAVMCSFFWLFHGGVQAKSRLGQLLRNVGSNSFLFFFSHPVGLVAGFFTYILVHNAYIAWLVAISVSVLLYTYLNRLQPRELFKNAKTWYIMMAAILLLPFLPSVIDHPAMSAVTRIVSFLIAIFAAINFSALAKLSKVKRTEPVEAKSLEVSV